jgi:hypothetical protein
VPISNGIPIKAAFSPEADSLAGSRIMVTGPPNRGISLPPSGWLKDGFVIVKTRFAE